MRCFENLLLAFGTILLLSRPASGQDLIHSFDGEQQSNRFGTVGCGAGDVDGDGTPDVIVGAYKFGGSLFAGRGRVYVYSGADFHAIWTLDGETSDAEFGAGIRDAGDVDADGHADFLVGAHRNAGPNGSDSGKAYLYSGQTGVPIWSWDGAVLGDFFGESIANAGDVDHDGILDVIVGARQTDTANGSNSGSAFVYSGATGLLLWQWDGEAADDEFGSSGGSSMVAGAGDLDADGHADLIVSSRLHDGPNGTDSGKAYVYSGATGLLIRSFDGANAHDDFGMCVGAIGDLDLDGVGEHFVGAMSALDTTATTRLGKVYVYSGASGTLLRTFTGDEPGSLFGIAVAAAGDHDSDGLPEILVSASLESLGTGGSQRGAVFLYSGANGRRLTRWNGEGDGDNFGNFVDDARDVNRDKVDDVITGAYFAAPNGPQSGKAYLFAGNDLYLEIAPRSAQGGDTVTLTTTAGKPGNLVIDVITEVDGVPLFFVLGAAFPFDANGELVLSGVVRSGLGPHAVTIKSFAIGRRGKLVASSTVALTLQ